jgi:nucleoside-diphosphate-sugar epimerase
MAAASSSAKPSVLVLGGLGMIGRNLVKYLVDNKLASFVRVADKRPSVFSDLSPEHKAALKGGDETVVEEVQVDLATEDGADTAFLTADGAAFDLVFNLAAETTAGRDDARYAQMSDIAKHCGKLAASSGVKKFLQVSTAHVYKSDKGASNESAALSPWTKVAKASLVAEGVIGAVPSLPVVIVRPSVVYGPGDERGLMPRCVCALAYVGSGEPMKFLWDKTLRCDTVHVFDVCRALWHLAARAVCSSGAPPPVFNLSSPEPTDQGKIAEVLEATFGIKTGFHGTIVSNLARVRMSDAVADANDSHAGPWLRALAENGIKHSPLSPFIHEELLYANHLAVDGSAITTDLGFAYKVPSLTPPAVKDMIARAVAQGIFPAVVAGKDLGLGTKAGASAAAATSS